MKRPAIFERVSALKFIDIETTALRGPDEGTDEIVEIAAATLDLERDEVVDEWSTLIKPSETVTDLKQVRIADGELTWKLGVFHGRHFDGVDWASGLTIDAALEGLASCGYLVDGATIAGQNPSFDLRHLRRDWERIRRYVECSCPSCAPTTERPWPKLDYHVIDLVSPAFMLAMTGAVPGCSLRHTAPLLANSTQKHRALDDVRDAVEVFRKLARLMARGVATRGPDFMQKGLALQVKP